jgi:LysM repeat protein
VTYSVTKTVLVDIVPVVLLLVIPLFAHAGVFTTLAGILSTEAHEEVRSDIDVDDIVLLKAATNYDPNPAKGGGDVVVLDGALVPDGGPLGIEGATKAKETNGAIGLYIVREGDSLSGIASMFGVSVNTILWANNIKKATGIKAGDELIILPITGVRHVVKKGDTVRSIAEKYKGDVADILAYNQLEKAEDIVVGETVVIPGGEVEIPKEPAKKAIPKSAKGATNTRGYFSNPVPGAVRTQGVHGYNGVDLAAPVGTLVKAAAAGDVIISKSEGWNGGYGQYIVVKHPNGTQTLYSHLSANSVKVGARVVQGQVIGAVGSSGKSTGPHLHFEVRGARNPF